MNEQSAARDALEAAGIHADREGLHLLPPEQMQQSDALQKECQEFLGKTKTFTEIVADFVNVMESRSTVIETEKLKVRPPLLRPAAAAGCRADPHIAFNPPVHGAI